MPNYLSIFYMYSIFGFTYYCTILSDYPITSVNKQAKKLANSIN